MYHARGTNPKQHSEPVRGFRCDISSICFARRSHWQYLVHLIKGHHYLSMHHVDGRSLVFGVTLIGSLAIIGLFHIIMLSQAAEPSNSQVVVLTLHKLQGIYSAVAGM